MRWGRFATFTLAAALAVMASDARAMSAALPEDTRCTVVGGDKLPVEAGGADALCAAVRQAIRAQAPHARYTAQLKIISRSRLTAAVTVDGRPLPEQTLSVMDRNLNPISIERFAQSLATKVAKAGTP